MESVSSVSISLQRRYAPCNVGSNSDAVLKTCFNSGQRSDLVDPYRVYWCTMKLESDGTMFAKPQLLRLVNSLSSTTQSRCTKDTLSINSASYALDTHNVLEVTSFSASYNLKRS